MKDCNTCRHHTQGYPNSNFRCNSCLLSNFELPHWEELDRYSHIPVDLLDEKPKGQSKRASLIESILNVGSGFIVSYGVWIWVAAPLFDIPTNHGQTFLITCLFTVTSLLRMYTVRRIGNWWHHRET